MIVLTCMGLLLSEVKILSVDEMRSGNGWKKLREREEDR